MAYEEGKNGPEKRRLPVQALKKRGKFLRRREKSHGMPEAVPRGGGLKRRMPFSLGSWEKRGGKGGWIFFPFRQEKREKKVTGKKKGESRSEGTINRS